jgi:hypothetical protein
VGCGGGTVSPDDPVSQEILVTAGPHHLGENVGAEGVDYQSTFQVTASFDSARVAITFLFPNSFDVSGPEIENAPKIFVNSIELGLTASHFPDDPACVSGTGAEREYACDITISLPATTAVIVGDNTIRVASEAAFGGNDDFVFSDLIVSILR